MRDLASKLCGLDRRRFLEYAARSTLGVSLMPALSSTVSAAGGKKPAQAGRGGKAKQMIYLFMAGGMTHLDTFDLKPGHANQGETQPISTSVTGVQISQYLPTLAAQFDKIAAIRSLHTQTGDHFAGEYLMRTSYEEIATERHPSLGPWIQHLKGRHSKTLPDTVLISAPARHPGAGFFDPTHSPLPIGDPNRGLENTIPPAYLMERSFDKRIKLIDTFDKKFRNKFRMQKVQSYTDFYSEATALLNSGELKAFDLNEEKAEVRDKYGRDPFGQGCLLARRLIQNDIRCVEVTCGGWDMHDSLFTGGNMPRRGAIMDQAVGTLISELSEMGLLDETIVVLTTEFGRSPTINYNAGRDHHPAVFSSLLAGGGIKGGQFYGQSDAAGHGVEKDGVTPEAFNATVATALGLPLDETVYSPTGRPFTVAHGGEPISALLA